MDSGLSSTERGILITTSTWLPEELKLGAHSANIFKTWLKMGVSWTRLVCRSLTVLAFDSLLLASAVSLDIPSSKAENEGLTFQQVLQSFSVVLSFSVSPLFIYILLQLRTMAAWLPLLFLFASPALSVILCPDDYHLASSCTLDLNTRWPCMVSFFGHLWVFLLLLEYY
ncbi:hypothetical protein EJ110_NYTH02562 [Nymphaea thermarum]|nr:hypothetical protein EJ110_NYTH02562 [Nymphaea thermarum]